MAVAFDAFTAFAPAVDPSGTHTPVGTPRAILAFLGRATAEPIVSATYGGVSFGSPVASISNSVGGETAGNTLEAYLLGASVPTGAQTVAINGGATAITLRVYSVTADGDVEFVDADSLESTSVANPSGTLALGGRACFVAQYFASGQDAVTGITPLTDWTSRSEVDLGPVTVGSYSYDLIDSIDVTLWLTQAAEDFVGLAVAISEVGSGSTIEPGLGSTPINGRTLGMGFGISLPDVA